MDLLRMLSNTPGVSGHEDAVQKIVWDELKPLCDKVWRDSIGNVFGLKKATKHTGDKAPVKVMFSAHSDEIGFMVKHIDANGFIKFTPLGGFDPRILMSLRVLIHGKKVVKGLIAPVVNSIEAGKKASTVSNDLQISDYYIDLGLPREEVIKYVSVGDIISFEQEFGFLNDKVVTGRNFDDRLGTYCMIEAMRRMGDTEVDIYAVSSVQEELGVRGAEIAAYTVNPDIGIAIDGSLSHDVPWAEDFQRTGVMGDGTGIYLVDNRTLGNPRLVKFLFDISSKYDIKCQKNIGGGTDASAMQRKRNGALCTTIGAPTRYMHSTVQLAHVDDLEATIKLLKYSGEHAHEIDLNFDF
jgi:tetrahedral aminopeptidase